MRSLIWFGFLFVFGTAAVSASAQNPFAVEDATSEVNSVNAGSGLGCQKRPTIQLY